MTAKQLRRISLLTGIALATTIGAASAQQTEGDETPPPSLPARPVILPMTPGTELNPTKPKTPKSSSKPRIIPIPATAGTGEPPTTTAALQPERPVKNATSDYTFCNRTSYAVSVAVGIRNGGLWATRGWWIIPAGECKIVIKGTLSQPAYYSFARSSFAHTGSIRTWGGTQTLCTGKANFQATSDGSDQCGPGFEAQGFAKVETSGKSAWTTTLTESANFKSLEQARIAGLQRLLYDIGRFDGPIDGAAGPKFSEALSQARSSLGIVSASDASGMYTKLLAEAAKGQAAAGLTFCNRTQDIVWSALGIDQQGKKQSQGWWRLQPGQCEKVIKDRLVDRYIYAFAAAERTEGVDQTWGGTVPFCTRDSLFQIEDASDCSGRGFESTGFLQIDTGGRPGITFEFAPRREDANQ